MNIFREKNDMTKNYLLKHTVLLALIIGLIACARNKNAEEDIMNQLAFQTDCWNSGDLDCFMNGYWRSDSLMFVSKDRVIYGYANTLERYKKSYPDESAMGILKFEIRHINKLSDDAYFVVGRYYLKRDPDIGDAEGNFTLLWKKIKGEWVIVADHTS